MSISANITIDVHGDLTFFMEGNLTYDNGFPLRKKLIHLSNKRPSTNIIIDFNKVDFVGSSGISLFVETIKALNKNKNRVFLKNVSNEFLKVFKLYQLDNYQEIILDLEEEYSYSNSKSL